MKEMTREEKAYRDISNAVNGCLNKEKFVDEFVKDHRYLQGEVFSLCLAIIERCARDDYGYDGRNEFAHRIAKEIVENNKRYF